MLGKKSVLILLAALVLGYKYSGGKEGSYRDNLSKWKEPKVNFVKPHPMNQAMLFTTAPEIVDAVAATTTGSIPSWLSGTLLRDGPGLFEFGEEHALHAFDGMAMIRRYHTNQNTGPGMNVSRKLIKSDILKSNLEEGRFTKYGVGTPAKGGVMDRLRNLGKPGADNVVVNTLKLFGHYYAATELPQVTEYDPVTLETIRKVDMTDKIPGVKIVTPHPLYDPDGTMWNIAFATGPDREGNSAGAWRYVIFKVTPPTTAEEERDPWINLEVVSEQPSSRAMSVSYLHSFFMTEHYLVFTEQPWIFGSLPETIFKHIIQGKSLGEIMYWDGESTTRFHVMEKSTGKILETKYEGDAMGFYHIINAYEENGNIFLDAPFKASPTSYGAFTIANLASDPVTYQNYMMSTGPTAGISKRWVLPLKVPEIFNPPAQLQLTEDGQVDPNSYPSLLSQEVTGAKAWHVEAATVYLQPELLAPVEQYEYHRAFEFVAVNPNYASKKYRYGYGLGFPTGYLCGSVQKLDVEKKMFTATWEDPSCRATEPQFVPRPGSSQEEDGVVVFACLGTSSEEPMTAFIVLDPVTLTELGRFSIPFTTPIGFHGVWVPGH